MFVFAKILYRGKRTPTSVRRRSSRVDFRLRNPNSPDVVFVMKALFSILDPQNRVETNTCFVFAHDFVLASRYLHFFPLLTYITDSKKFLRCLLFTDGRLQLQHSDTSTKLYRTCPEIWYARGLLSCLLGHQSTQSRKNLSCNPSVHVDSLICKLQHFRFLPTRRNGQIFL